MKDIVYLPWRDIHNIRKEGFRVRESNILKSLQERTDVGKILVINKAENLKSKLLSNKTGMEIEDQIWADDILLTKTMGAHLFRIKENLFSLNLPKFLFNKGDNELEAIKIMQKYTYKVIINALDYLSIDIDAKETLIWASDLSRSYLFSEFQKRGFNCHKVFDSIDNLLEHSSYSEKAKIKKQRDYAVIDDLADTIFSVSKENLRVLFPNNQNKDYVSNGVDNRRFESVLEKINKDSKITCGYIGVIENRIDFELVKELAILNKNVNFVFTGVILESCLPIVNELKQIKNIIFKGPINYNSIPYELSNFDICMIPHKINKFTQSMSPLKFYEYIAANKPVILSKVPPWQEVKDISGVYVADNLNDWNDSMKEIMYSREGINYNDDHQRNKLLSINAWDNITDKMIRIINNR